MTLPDIHIPGMPFTGGGKPGFQRLGGATRKEDSREEALRKAKEERAARLSAKKQARGAVLIQASGHLRPGTKSSSLGQRHDCVATRDTSCVALR